MPDTEVTFPDQKIKSHHHLRHDFDWASRPEPWNWIGPQFRAECERIGPRVEIKAPPRWKEIKRRREALGMSQLDLAREAKCRQPVLSNIELNRGGNPSAAAATVRVLSALDRIEKEPTP
jgi:hypothetical protein